jgi:putative membrane protein
MQPFLIRWAMTTVAVLAAAQIVPGIGYETWTALLVASLCLGLINATLKPILIFLSFPLIIMTLGIFTIVLNSLFLWSVGHLVRGFWVHGWWSAFLGSLVISVVTILLKTFESQPASQRAARRRAPAQVRPPPSSGRGRVIDV